MHNQMLLWERSGLSWWLWTGRWWGSVLAFCSIISIWIFFYLVLGNELDCCSDLSLASAGPYFCFCEQYVEAACTLLVQCTGKVTAVLGGLLAMYTRAERESTRWYRLIYPAWAETLDCMTSKDPFWTSVVLWFLWGGKEMWYQSVTTALSVSHPDLLTALDEGISVW